MEQRDLSLLLTYRDVDPSSPVGLIWVVTDDDLEAIGKNAVRKSYYAEWGRMAECAEFIDQFQYVLVATPNDAEREEIVGGLLDRINVPLLLAEKAAFRGCDSAADLFRTYPGALKNLIYGAVEIPRPGLLDLSTVPTTEAVPKNRVMSGFLPMDYCTGGFCGGQISIWTGRRGEGKSTLLGQLMAEAVQQNRAVCAYSGELPAAQFKRSVALQIAGPGNLRKVPDPVTGRFEYEPADMGPIDRWLEGKFFLTDIRQATAHDEDYIISLFEYAARRYGCSVFLVDNIMTTQLKGEKELGHLGAQKEFVRRLCAFAKSRDVHVHMVAHPRKAGDKALSADDIAGANEIGNLADKLFSVERQESGTLVRILKDRQTGSRAKIELDFEERSRRFYDHGGNPNKKYSWEAYVNGHG